MLSTNVGRLVKRVTHKIEAVVWDRMIQPRYYAIAPHEFVAKTEAGFAIGGDTTSSVERTICYFNIWEPNATAWLERTLAPGDGFVDLGSHVGYFAALAAHLVGPAGCVVAVEAAPPTYRKLVANIERNGFTNVRAVNLAIGAEAGTVQFYEDGDCGHNTMFAQDGFAPAFEVQCKPLAEVVTREELARARVIKIDVEGAEWPVASDLLAVAPTLRPDVEIMLEISCAILERDGKSAAQLIEIFSHAGFHAYRLRNEYPLLAYRKPREIAPPTRLDGPLSGVVDLVFSRTANDAL